MIKKQQNDAPFETANTPAKNEGSGVGCNDAPGESNKKKLETLNTENFAPRYSD